MQIRSHVQTGSIQAYVYKFRKLMANIPSMSMDEAYHSFITGLQPHLRQLVGTLIPKNDLEAAIDIAQRSTAYEGDKWADRKSLEAEANSKTDLDGDTSPKSSSRLHSRLKEISSLRLQLR